MDLPREIFSGHWHEGHIQGIAVDTEKGFVYYSFTTILLKTDLQGNPVGSVRNLAGHLGCITFDAARRRVYGSLELKHDSIGKGIIARTGWDPSDEDNFYLVSFDVDRITRMEMDAEADGIMLAVWLSDVLRDYKGTDSATGLPHAYGCSGFDGTGLGPVFGAAADSPKKIMVAYGIYGDVERTGNDCQVILQYDPDIFPCYGTALNQSQPHHNGPESCEARYFVHTGNTRWGVQNLEYDPHSETWLAAVYQGEKEVFTNFPLFVIDATAAPKLQALPGRNGETGNLLTLVNTGTVGRHDIPGLWMPLGSTGIAALGDGRFYFSRNDSKAAERSFCSTLLLYRRDNTSPEGFAQCV